jgi:hypothetical protein
MLQLFGLDQRWEVDTVRERLATNAVVWFWQRCMGRAHHLLPTMRPRKGGRVIVVIEELGKWCIGSRGKGQICEGTRKARERQEEEVPGQPNSGL